MDVFQQLPVADIEHALKKIFKLSDTKEYWSARQGCIQGGGGGGVLGFPPPPQKIYNPARHQYSAAG